MLRQRLGKSAAPFNRQGQFADDGFEGAVALLFFENAQPAQEGQAGIHQRRQLPREGRQYFLFYPAAESGDFDLNVERAAFFAAAGPGFFLAGLLFLDFFGLGNFGREQAHLLHAANGLVLGGDFQAALRFVAAGVQCHVIVLWHSG